MNKLIVKTGIMLLLLAIGACTSSEEEIIGSIYGKVTDSKNGKSAARSDYHIDTRRTVAHYG